MSRTAPYHLIAGLLAVTSLLFVTSLGCGSEAMEEAIPAATSAPQSPPEGAGTPETPRPSPQTVVATETMAPKPSLEAVVASGTEVPEASPVVESARETTPPEPSPQSLEGAGESVPPSSPDTGGDPTCCLLPPPSPTATGTGPGGPVIGSAVDYVEGVGVKQEILPGNDHVDMNDDPSDDIVAYDSFPPTSGDHWSTPARCGFYIQPVPDELVVHNMEHSNIVVSYNLTTQDDFDALVNVYEDLPEFWRDHFTVVRPYAKISEGKVAVSAWGVLDEMNGVDPGRIMRFFEHYVGRLGPEGAISCRGLQQSMPGS